MKINLESTEEIYMLSGLPVRLWRGSTEGGVPVQAFITLISVPAGSDQAEFLRELARVEAPDV